MILVSVAKAVEWMGVAILMIYTRLGIRGYLDVEKLKSLNIGEWLSVQCGGDQQSSRFPVFC
jgi:hypothetical protein